MLHARSLLYRNCRREFMGLGSLSVASSPPRPSLWDHRGSHCPFGALVLSSSFLTPHFGVLWFALVCAGVLWWALVGRGLHCACFSMQVVWCLRWLCFETTSPTLGTTSPGPISAYVARCPLAILALAPPCPKPLPMSCCFKLACSSTYGACSFPFHPSVCLCR